LELGYKEVVTVPNDVTAKEAFEILKDRVCVMLSIYALAGCITDVLLAATIQNVSSAAVVNDGGKMVEVISTSDMRILLNESTPDEPLPLSLLDLPVTQYLQKRVVASDALQVVCGVVSTTTVIDRACD
jgi:CBS domain-containing protein